MTISELIMLMKQKCKAQGYTYEQLSKDCGIPRSTIAKIFSGETDIPRKETLEKINSVLQISTPNLVYLDDNKAEDNEVLSFIQGKEDINLTDISKMLEGTLNQLKETTTSLSALKAIIDGKIEPIDCYKFD